MSTLAQRLQHAMEVRRVTQADLARASGITVGHISHLRRGTRGGATGATTIGALARALGVSVEWLGTGEGPPPDQQELPMRLRHRAEWGEVAARVRDEHPELEPAALATVGEMLDDPSLPMLDAVFVRDLAFAVGSLRARAARRTK